MAERIPNKKIAAAVAFIILVALIFSAMPANAVQEDIVLNVEAGFNNRARYGSYVPFRITVQNKGRSIEGEIHVIVDTTYDTSVIYASPIDLPGGAVKELTINVPVYTANRNVRVSLVQGRKTLETVNYEFSSLISPITPVVGVLSDDPAVYTQLKGIRLTEVVDDRRMAEIMTKMGPVVTKSSSIITLEQTEAELILLNKGKFPSDAYGMSNFDYMVITNFDTSTLSDKQINALLDWVREGNILILAAGYHASGVYAGLKDVLDLPDITGTTTINEAWELEQSVGIDLPGDIYISELSANEEDIVIEEQGKPLVMAFMYGRGTVSVLAFDPFSAHVATNGNSKQLTEHVFKSILAKSTAGLAESNISYAIRENMSNVRYLASQVPETKTPPYQLMLIIVGIYILLVGPVLYIILKITDKRDLSWVIIPSMAVLFMGIIYVAGYKTRFTESVLNNISVIYIDPESETTRIETAMAVFGNERGRLKIEYERDDGIDILQSSEFLDHVGYSYYSSVAANQVNSLVKAKYTDSDPVIYELYDSQLWSPNYFRASRQIEGKGSIIESFSLENGILNVNLNNKTGLALKNSFLRLGNIFIGVGNLLPGDAKSIRVDTKAKASDTFKTFITKWLGPAGFTSGQQVTPEIRENIRKQDMINNIFGKILEDDYTGSGEILLLFFAFNDSDPGYRLKVNDKDPRVYNTNIIYTWKAMDMSKGSRVEYPMGVIKPVYESLEDKNMEYYGDEYGTMVRVLEGGNYDYVFSLPEKMNPDWISVKWPEVIINDIINEPVPTVRANIRYYIYNFEEMKWEETDRSCDFTDVTGSMVSGKNVVRVRISIEFISEVTKMVRFRGPEIAIGGVVQ
ncbi:MAG TPA: hypothetical protein GXX49_02765 [Clostridiaceae bacterium]|nr:hypothetical protein [Clostridiaceae bacterium]